MDIKKYFEQPLYNGKRKKMRLTQCEMAKALEKSQPLIAYMIAGGTVASKVAIDLHKLTKGKIHKADSRPDLWSR